LPSGARHIQRFEHGGATLVDEILDGASNRHMVFLHGWGANRESLRGIGVLFQNSAVVHLLDLPGFGDAPPPPPDWDTARYADLVQSYLLTLPSGPVLLVGHSFGARVSIRLAARRLNQLRGSVLMASPGLPPPAISAVRIRRAAIRLLRRAFYLIKPITGGGLIDWHTRTFGSADYLAAGPLRSVFVRIVAETYEEDVRAIQSPVLFLYGSDDRETPPSLAYRFKALMDGHASVEILPHKDHHLYMGTGAHLCAFKIRGWLDAHGG
jgi:pimeloyl-ACP methyl ester carboxylesterase